MLATSQSAEFSGTPLPAGWTIEPLAGGASMANGKLVTDGAAVLAPLMTGSGKTLEFAATFSGAPDQSIGFGASGALASPMAMFVIKSDRQLSYR